MQCPTKKQCEHNYIPHYLKAIIEQSKKRGGKTHTVIKISDKTQLRRITPGIVFSVMFVSPLLYFPVNYLKERPVNRRFSTR